MKTLFRILVITIIGLSMGCSNDDGSSDEGEIVFEVFDVPIVYKQYDVPQAIQNYSGVTVYALAIFDQKLDATNYTLTFESTTAPNLNFQISWENGQPVPDPGAAVPGIIPGYNLGLVGSQYYIVILDSGCQGAVGGSCTVGGETPNTLEQNLMNAGGEVTVEITYD